MIGSGISRWTIPRGTEYFFKHRYPCFGGRAQGAHLESPTTHQSVHLALSGDQGARDS
jgi:hypothetical protein